MCIYIMYSMKMFFSLSRRNTSFYAKFVHFSYRLPVLHSCGLQYNVLSGLSVSKEKYIPMHYPGRKPFTCKFIVAMVSAFRSFAKIKNNIM